MQLSDYLLKRVFKKSQRGALELGFECLCQKGLGPGFDLISRENLITEQSNLKTTHLRDPTEHHNFELDQAYVSEPHDCDDGFEANAHKIKFTIEQTPINPKEDPEPEQNSPSETSPTTLFHKISSKAIISPSRAPETPRNDSTLDPQSPPQTPHTQTPHTQPPQTPENPKSDSQTPDTITASDPNPTHYLSNQTLKFYKNTSKGS